MSGSSVAETETEDRTPATARAFWARKIFSFCGIVPLALYTLWHLGNNIYALRGPAAFDARLAQATGSPLHRPAIWLFVYLPFLIHAAVGLAITFKSSPNVLRMPAFRNWKYLLQRVSAIGLLLFIPAHVYKTRIEPWREGFAIDYAHMHAGMLEPLTFAVYTLGMLGIAFHLANGLWLAGITWGFFRGPAAQRRGEWLSIAFGLVLLALAFTAIFALRA
jgi:succinate dehydrogenase / fumarate reductase cytochrome b subunit